MRMGTTRFLLLLRASPRQMVKSNLFFWSLSPVPLRTRPSPVETTAYLRLTPCLHDCFVYTPFILYIDSMPEINLTQSSLSLIEPCMLATYLTTTRHIQFNTNQPIIPMHLNPSIIFPPSTEILMQNHRTTPKPKLTLYRYLAETFTSINPTTTNSTLHPTPHSNHPPNPISTHPPPPRCKVLLFLRCVLNTLCLKDCGENPPSSSPPVTTFSTPSIPIPPVLSLSLG